MSRVETAPEPRVEAIMRDNVIRGYVIHVPRGALVQVDEVGVFLRADLNDPEFDEQPYVTIDTSEMPRQFHYDEATGERGIETAGMPIIAVHLNDGDEIYDDMGNGNITGQRP